jgi:AraC-like DNA-binding protein
MCIRTRDLCVRCLGVSCRVLLGSGLDMPSKGVALSSTRSSTLLKSSLCRGYFFRRRSLGHCTEAQGIDRDTRKTQPAICGSIERRSRPRALPPKWQRPLSPSPVRGGLANWQHRLIINYVEDNLSNDISVAQLAEVAQLSLYHFCRTFKQSFGEPPHCYHTRRRIERAKALLANSKRSITEIAMDVGFSETSSFSTAFRRVTKGTPTSYRRSLV